MKNRYDKKSQGLFFNKSRFFPILSFFRFIRIIFPTKETTIKYFLPLYNYYLKCTNKEQNFKIYRSKPRTIGRHCRGTANRSPDYLNGNSIIEKKLGPEQVRQLMDNARQIMSGKAIITGCA